MNIYQNCMALRLNNVQKSYLLSVPKIAMTQMLNILKCLKIAQKTDLKRGTVKYLILKIISVSFSFSSPVGYFCT